MDDITNFKDFICNIKEVMSSFFYPNEVADDKFSNKEHKHPIDNSLNDVSENPVQNKVIKTAMDNKADNVLASSSVDGLMSKSDFAKLQSVEDGANKIVVDSSLKSSSVNPVQNKVIKTALDSKADNTLVSGSSNGLMRSGDYTKLSGIENNANKIVVDNSLDDSSTNPVQNKVIKTELNKKADNNVFATVNNDGLMTRDYVNIITNLQQDVMELQNKVDKNDVRILFMRYKNGIFEGEDATNLVLDPGDYIYCKIVSDDTSYDASGKKVRMFINGGVYERTTGSDGVTTGGLVISSTFPKGYFVMSAFITGSRGKNMIVDHKIIQVI